MVSGRLFLPSKKKQKTNNYGKNKALRPFIIFSGETKKKNKRKMPLKIKKSAVIILERSDPAEAERRWRRIFLPIIFIGGLYFIRQKYGRKWRRKQKIK